MEKPLIRRLFSFKPSSFKEGEKMNLWQRIDDVMHIGKCEGL